MTQALQGIRVLDFTHVLAGPYCSMILGDLGADIIKVERYGAGDSLRRWGPPFMPDGESTYFLAVNRNKRGISLDLKSDAGRALALQLVRESDVLLENFRAGVMDSLGLGYDRLREINSRLVYGSITAYGTGGPLTERPGYDVVAQGMTGLMSVTGDPQGQPMRVGVAVSDMVTGLYWAIAILGALQSRSRSGEGQRVDLSLLEATLSIMPNLTAAFLMAGVVPERHGNGHPNVVPYNVYATRDGNLTLALGNDAQWQRLCEAAGHPEFASDARYSENQSRVARRAEVDALVSGWFRQRTTDEWVDLLSEKEVPCGPIYGLDRILHHPQVAALGLIKNILHPTSGNLRMVGAPFHLSADDTEPYRPPPRLGEHTREVLREVLSLTDADLEELRRKGAFGTGAPPS